MRTPHLLLASVILAASVFGSGFAQAEEPYVLAQADPQAEAESEPAGQRPQAGSGGIEEIVIQAGESESASDFESGDSVAAFDASDLEALGAQTVADLANFTPNLEIVTSGATTPTFFIRGVGLNDFNANSTGAVAIYQDDVVLNSPALQLGTLFDTGAVNILRGPQGTGMARNASAGAIKLYSRRPSGEFGAYLRSTYGNYDYLDFEGAVEAPVYEDILSTRFSFRYSQRDGYAKNGCGDAIPADERGIRSTEQSNARFTNGGLPLSLCGEEVARVGQVISLNPLVRSDGKSTIEEGLPTRVNDLGNWAARGMILFQPTLDMEWLVIGRFSKRDELSRLGQSYGTTGGILTPQNELVQIGVLGGQDAAGYQPLEVVERLNESNPCLNVDGSDNGNCDGLSGIEKRTLAIPGRLEVADELAANLDDKPHVGDYNRIGRTQNDTWGTSIRGEIMLGDSVLVSTVTSYDTYDRKVDIDLDFSPNQLFEVVTDDDGWQFTQALEASSRLAENIPIQWSVGGFTLVEQINVSIENFFEPLLAFAGVSNRQYTQEGISGGAYLSLAWDFWKKFTLDGGVRYNIENKTLEYVLQQASSPFPTVSFNDETWDAPTGLIRLTYRFREDTHAYFKFTRGWKSGHYNATSSPNSGVTTADPETINAFEGGIRGSWWDGRIGLDFSIFHYDYNDYQIFISEQRLGGQPEFVVINADNAEVYGAEVDLITRPFPGTYIQARFGWLESQFLDFVQEQFAQRARGLGSVTIRKETNNIGNPLLNSPRFKVSMTAEQSVPLGRFGSLTARYDGAWTDDVKFDATDGKGIPDATGKQFLPENTIGQRAYWLHNVQVGYRTPNGTVEVQGWVRNIADEAYKTFAFDASTFNATTIYFVGEPRTYGVNLTVSF